MSWKPERVLVYRKGASRRNPRSPPPVAAPGIRVGIWDLDASAGSLPRLLDEVDACQSQFSFFSVEAPYQTGLTFPGPHVAHEWREYTGKIMNPLAAAANVSARMIVSAAKPVLRTLPVDWLIIVVKSMISDTTDPKSAWHNLFSTHSGKIIVVSTYELREYSALGRRPFEVTVFGSGLSALLAAMVPRIKYQKQSTGSIFDFCENRTDIVKSIRNPHIDDTNRARIPPALLEPTEKILEVLKRYQGVVVRPPAKRTRKALTRAPSRQKKRGVLSNIPSASFTDVLKTLSTLLPKKK